MTDAADCLTIPEVAERLQMTPDGVYKLIQRGKLKAIRISERKTRIAAAALAEYEAATQAWVERYLDEYAATAVDNPEEDFVSATGQTPDAWLAAWKRDELEDSAENMQLLAYAAALVFNRDAADGDVPGVRQLATPTRRRR